METPHKNNAVPIKDVTELKRWLSELPTLDPEQNVKRIQVSLHGHNTADFGPDLRISLLGCYLGPVASLNHDLLKHRMGLSLPLPQAALRITNALRELYQEFALGYQIVVNEITSKKGLILDDPAIMTLTKAIYGVTFCLNQVLRCAYESYRLVPLGTWKQLHKVFQLARTCGIDNEEFVGVDGRTVSIVHEYKRALLLGLSEPYQLPFRRVNTVFHCLNQWVAHARLLYAIDKDKGPECLFIVDTDSDHPAIPLLSPTKVDSTERDLVLDTSELITKLNSKMGSSILDTLTTKGEVRNYEEIETLKVLITYWRAHPMRRHRRTASRANYAVIVGLTNIARELTKDKNLVTRSEENDDDSSDVVRGTFGHQQHLRAKSRILPVPWEAVDESLSGLRFNVNSSHGTPVSVGELVAVRPVDEEGNWCVGIVRWAKEGHSNTVDLGIYKIGEDVRSLTARRVSEKQPETPYEDYAALFVPADATIKRAQTLIIHNGLYKPGQLLWLRSQSVDHIVEATNLILAGRPFEWFEVRVNREFGLNRDLGYFDGNESSGSTHWRL
ncbi:MAG: hypothetical protein QNI91_11435 [Arenicellales bacterium]|nr:hypothetical protein [Arenicellales bacterium]